MFKIVWICILLSRIFESAIESLVKNTAIFWMNALMGSWYMYVKTGYIVMTIKIIVPVNELFFIV